MESWINVVFEGLHLFNL